MNDTLVVADVSQNHPFGGINLEVSLPALATSTKLWCFQAGQFLSIHHFAKLMGLQMEDVVLQRRFTEAWFHARLDAAAHIANFGLVLMAAIAVPLNTLVNGKS